jgi:hypothetical protein
VAVAGGALEALVVTVASFEGIFTTDLSVVGGPAMLATVTAEVLEICAGAAGGLDPTNAFDPSNAVVPSDALVPADEFRALAKGSDGGRTDSISVLFPTSNGNDPS